MSTVEKSIEIDVPVRAVYNQWTQFEEFPEFMEGVQEVRQLDDKRLHWKAVIAGKEKEWTSVILEQTPDKVVAWKSTSGTASGGRVTFESLGKDKTRLTVHLEYDPDGVLEKVGDAVGVVSRRVEADLQRFKEFIEARGKATGGWRGEIHGGKVESAPQKKGGGTGKDSG